MLYNDQDSLCAQCQPLRKTVPNPCFQISPQRSHPTQRTYLVDRHGATQHIQNPTFKSFSNCIIPNSFNGITTNSAALEFIQSFPQPQHLICHQVLYIPLKNISLTF